MGTSKLFVSMETYEVRPRKDHRGVHLISDALPFGRLWCRLGHFARVPFLVVQNEPANPIRISLFGADTEMLAPNYIPEFRFAAGNLGR